MNKQNDMKPLAQIGTSIDNIEDRIGFAAYTVARKKWNLNIDAGQYDPASPPFVDYETWKAGEIERVKRALRRDAALNELYSLDREPLYLFEGLIRERVRDGKL